MPGRRHYRPSGKVDLFMFLPLFLLTLAATIGGGALLDVLLRVGGYYMLVTPIICALPGAVFLYLALRFGKCRNRLLGVLIVPLITALFWVAYFQTGLVQMSHGNVSYFELQYLPKYVHFRMKYQTTESTPGSPSKREPGKGDLVMNYALLVFESLAILAVFAGTAAARFEYCFCERCDCWMTTLKRIFSTGSSPVFQTALETGDFSVAHQLNPEMVTPEQACCRTSIHFCRDCCQKEEDAGYFTYLEVSGSINWKRGQTRKLALSQDELRGLLPIMDDVHTPSAPVVAAEHEDGHAQAEPVARALAVITKVSDPVVLSSRNRIINAVLGFLPVVGMIIGFLLLAGGLAMVSPDIGEWKLPIAPAVGWTLAGIGGLVGISCLVICIRGPARLSDRHFRNLLNQVIGRRRDAIVTNNDRHVIHCEFIPRENWRIMLNTAADMGYLKVDKGAGQILFEGDAERYEIPFDSVESCEPSIVQFSQGVTTPLIIFKVLTERGPIELPLYPFALESTLKGDKRIKKLESFHSELVSLLPASEGGEPVPDGPADTLF